MADKKVDEYGYDQVNEIETGSGRYLSFRKGDKGRVIQLRVVSKPRYVNQHWILASDGKQSPIKCKGEDCPYCGKDVPVGEKLDKTAKWGWVVIDREDGKAKVFTGPTLIARKIKDLVENPKWGNPFLYDIEIRRDEGAGAGYYSVTPDPEGKGKEITEKEKKLVEDGKFDLVSELEGSKESQHMGKYEGATELDEAKKGSPENEVKPDDIPF